MFDTVQLSLFFCEDVRMEMSGKPFLIGMLSPVIYGGDEGSDDAFFLVTSVTAPSSIREVDLELSVTIEGPDREPVTKTHSQAIDIDELQDDDEPWKTWLPLKIVVPNCAPGAKVTATLKSAYGSAWASLAVRSREDLPEEDDSID